MDSSPDAPLRSASRGPAAAARRRGARQVDRVDAGDVGVQPRAMNVCWAAAVMPKPPSGMRTARPAALAVRAPPRRPARRAAASGPGWRRSGRRQDRSTPSTRTIASMFSPACACSACTMTASLADARAQLLGNVAPEPCARARPTPAARQSGAPARPIARHSPPARGRCPASPGLLQVAQRSLRARDGRPRAAAVRPAAAGVDPRYRPAVPLGRRRVRGAPRPLVARRCTRRRGPGAGRGRGVAGAASHAQGRSASPSASARGVGDRHPAPDDLVASADAACYRAKAAGATVTPLAGARGS